MQQDIISMKKVSQIFNIDLKNLKEDLKQNSSLYPDVVTFKRGALNQKGWYLEQLPEIGAKFGFLKTNFSGSKVLSVFTTKGGVLKSTLSLNIARTAALHGVKTCVIGLDIQGDVTTALGHEYSFQDGDDIDDVLKKVDEVKGITDYFQNRENLTDLIVPTDLKNLYYIPETPELAALNDALNNINRREYWLRDKVIANLRQFFDLIILDCSPNWNKLTTNALVASDLLVGPLECKINNFRNFKVYRHFLEEFKRDMQLSLDVCYVPTRYSVNRKLSKEIKLWYQENIENCMPFGVRESVAGEEATALNLSILEHAPTKNVAKEVRQVISHIFDILSEEKSEPYFNKAGRCDPDSEISQTDLCFN